MSAPRAARPAGLSGAAPALAAGALLAALLLVRIDAPWTFIHDDNGAWTQAVASSHLIAGLARTRGQDFFLRRDDGALEPYLHHPPLYPLAVTAVYAVTHRADPLTTRLVPAAFHLAGFAGFVLLGRLLLGGDPLARAVAVFVYALVPMSCFFGKTTFNEPLGLCLVVWATYFLASWRLRPRAGALAASAALWTLAGFASWPAFAILFAQFLLLFFEASAGRDRSRRPAVAALAAVGLVTFLLVLIHLEWANGWGPNRSTGAAENWGIYAMSPVRAIKAIGRAFDFHRIYFANVPFLLFLVWGAARLRALLRGGRLGEAERVVAAGVLGSTLWALLFVRQVALHGYGQFWFLPFESLAVGMIAASLWRRSAARPRLRAVLATAAVLGTLVSAAGTLRHRYGTPHGYAIRTSKEMAARYVTNPWEPRGAASGEARSAAEPEDQKR